MLNCSAQRNTRVHGEIPDWAAEAEAVDQIDCYGHICRIDRHYLVMHFGIIDVAVRKVDLAGAYAERDHGCVVDHVAGINDSHQRTVM